MKPEVAAVRDPVRPTVGEERAVERLHEVLEGSAGAAAQLVAGDGRRLDLPDSVYQVLVRVVHELAQGNAVAVLPVQAQLTTQQAADLLGVSRPYFVKLLDEKQIPYDRPRKHRRVLLSDVLAYKQRRDADRRAALDELTDEDERLGLRFA